MKILGTIILLLFGTFSFAQHKQEPIGMSASYDKETFDIVTYTPPRGMEKITYTNIPEITYKVTDQQKGTFCQITITKSMNGTNNADVAFASAWNHLSKTANVTAQPVIVPSKLNGWDIRSGVAFFVYNGRQTMQQFITMSGDGKLAGISIYTNSQDYQIDINNFLASISLPQLETNLQHAPANNEAPVILPFLTGACSRRF